MIVLHSIDNKLHFTKLTCADLKLREMTIPVTDVEAGGKVLLTTVSDQTKRYGLVQAAWTTCSDVPLLTSSETARQWWCRLKDSVETEGESVAEIISETSKAPLSLQVSAD